MRDASETASYAARREYADWCWAGNWSSWRALRRGQSTAPILTVRFRGKLIPLHLRPGTLDLEIARLILREDSEYRVPVEADPRLIVDIGANIGMASVYFGLTYPKARIVACEPEAGNLDLFHEHTTACPGHDRITIVPMAVGETSGVRTYAYSRDARNLGGGTFANLSADPARQTVLPMTTLAALCEDLKLRSIDILKVDTEGSEWGDSR